MRLDESKLRHPAENPIYLGAIFVNLALIVAAVLAVVYAADWLQGFPRLEQRVNQLRAAGAALLLVPFALIVTRNKRRTKFRANAVRVSRTQMPAIYETLETMCAQLGMQTLPEVFVSDDVPDPSQAYSTLKGHFISLHEKILELDLDVGRDMFSFFLARELGRIRLGHTTWLNEVLVAYLGRIPILRNPLLHARTFSQDRYSAYLAPDSLRGLVLSATGRRMLEKVDVDEYLRQVRGEASWVTRIAALSQTTPYLSLRIAELEKAGLLMRKHRASADVPAVDAAVAVSPVRELGEPMHSR